MFFFTAEMTVGYVHTSATVLESDGVAQLTVAISTPPGTDPIEMSFFLLVNTVDQTATGLLWRLGSDTTIRTSLTLKQLQQ